MKKSLTLLSAGLMVALMSCNSKTESTATESDSMNVDDNATVSTSSATVVPGSYVNLSTGKTVYIVKDEATGYAMDSIAKIPVDFYINTSTNDTIYRTGFVVNNAIVKTSEGTYQLDETKLKVDGDEIKFKDEDTKIKVDGEDSKVKDGDYKQKIDGDESKTKTGDTKTKTEDGVITKQKTTN